MFTERPSASGRGLATTCLSACPDTARLSLESNLRTAPEGMTGALTGVGHGFAAFNPSGPAAVDMLEQGCGLDLDPSAFTERICAMTALARMRRAAMWRACGTG
jgi:sarcosine oxidase gamma subunit